MVVSDALFGAAKRTLQELGTPAEKQRAYVRDHPELTGYDAALLTQSREISAYFDETIGALRGNAKLAASWVTGELAAALNRAGLEIGRSPVSAAKLGRLLQRLEDGTLNARQAKDVFRLLWESGDEVDAVIEAKGLKQITDAGELESVVEQVLAANPKSVQEYRAGKEKAFNALVGQAMKATRGKGNPVEINRLLKKKLDA